MHYPGILLIYVFSLLVRSHLSGKLIVLVCCVLAVDFRLLHRHDFLALVLPEICLLFSFLCLLTEHNQYQVCTALVHRAALLITR